MTKGKHRRRAEGRDAERVASTVAELTTQIAAETARRDNAADEAAVVEGLKIRLANLEAARDRTAAGELARIEAVIADYAIAVEAEEQHHERLQAAWNDTVSLFRSTFGGGVEGTEAVMRAIGVMSHGQMLQPEHTERLPRRLIAQLQVARGGRRDLSVLEGDESDDDAVGPVAFPWLRPSVRDALIAEHGRATAANTSKTLRRSTPFHGTRDHVWTWMQANPGSFGPDSDLGEWGYAWDHWDDWFAAAPADGVVAAATADAAAREEVLLRAQDRWINMFQPAPLFPRPADVVAYRWWYWHCAARHEVWIAEGPFLDDDHPSGGEPDTDPDQSRAPGFETRTIRGKTFRFPTGWVDTNDNGFDGDPPPSARLWRDAAVMLRTAVPFWLPPGQTAAYLESDPIPADDLADIRLPFGRVLVIPAEPIVLEGTGPGTADEARMIAEIDTDFRRLARRVRVAEDYGTHYRQNPDVGDLLRIYGAHIEGVVVEADQSGRPTNRVVWCVAIPTADSTAVLFRLPIVGLASKSPLRDIVDQLSAVVAWGHWGEHPVDDELTAQPPGKQKHGHAPPTPVHILDVAKTTTEPADLTSPTGRTVAPHRRRGHWRRQHYGPRGELIKRVRIAPVLVNATRGPLAPQVYRLPRPQPSQPNSGDPRG